MGIENGSSSAEILEENLEAFREDLEGAIELAKDEGFNTPCKAYPHLRNL